MIQQERIVEREEDEGAKKLRKRFQTDIMLTLEYQRREIMKWNIFIA